MQVFVAQFETAFKFAEANAAWIIIGVLVLTGTGFAVRMLGRILRGGKEG